MQCQLNIGDEKSIDLLKYVKCCQHVSQRLKDANYAKPAFEQYAEKRAIAAAMSTALALKKVNISIMTTQTISFTNPRRRQTTIYEQV